MGKKLSDFKDYKEFLEYIQDKDIEFQKLYIDDINNAFFKLWDSNPSMEEFAKYTRGVLLSPEMLYYMIKNKR